MTCTNLHLTNTDYDDGLCRAIVQGSDYDMLDLYIEGDYSAYTPSGQIKDNYADLGGIVLATFDFLPNVYGIFTLPTTPPVTGNFTKVSPRLSAAATQLIPAPSRTRVDASDAVRVGKNVWVYDIELALGSAVLPKIGAGWVEVTREVTRP